MKLLPSNLMIESIPEWMRVLEDRRGDVDRGLWGTDLSDRQQGTVREFYYSNLDAWRALTDDWPMYGSIAGGRWFIWPE